MFGREKDINLFVGQLLISVSQEGLMNIYETIPPSLRLFVSLHQGRAQKSFC